MKYQDLKDRAELLSIELESLKKENAGLRDSVAKWKDSWFYLRELYAGLYWHHPAISSEGELGYFKDNLKKLGL